MAQTLDIRQKARLRKAMYAKPTIIALVLLLAFVVHGSWGMYQKSAVANANKMKAEELVSELQVREKQLSEDIVGLSTERGIEEEIRERFMVAKEGEGVIIIADPEVDEVHTVTVSEPSGNARDRQSLRPRAREHQGVPRCASDYVH